MAQTTALASTDGSFRQTIWRTYALLLLPVVLVVVFYWPSINSLIATWNDYSNLGNTHGWLVAAVVMWLFYDVARQLPALALRPSRSAIALLGAGSLAWLLFLQVNVQIGYQLLVPVLSWLAVASLYGYAVARRLTFANSYFYFAVPIWGSLTGFFQWGSIFAVRLMLRVVAVPAYFEDNAVFLPKGSFRVEGGCSGLHFVVVAMAIAALYVYMRRIRRPYGVLLLAGLLAVLTNWVRIFVIVVAGYLTDMQHYLVRVEHYRFGWLVFAVALAIFFFIAERMHHEIAPEPVAIPDLPSLSTPAHLFFLTALALAAGPIWHYLLESRDPAVANVSVHLPGIASIATQERVGDWSPIFLNADEQALTRYRVSDYTLDVFRAVFIEQHQGKKLAGYNNSIAGPGYSVLAQAPVGSSAPGYLQTTVIDRNNRKWMIWHSYDVGEYRFRSPFIAQNVYGLRSLFVRETAGVTALRIECLPSCAAVLPILSQVTHALATAP